MPPALTDYENPQGSAGIKVLAVTDELLQFLEANSEVLETANFLFHVTGFGMGGGPDDCL
jgi:hypothetical protein